MISAAYAAGFFDGEGSVYAATRRKTPVAARAPTLIVCISNTNLQVLELHRERWGGSINERKMSRPNRQRQWQWVISSRMAKPYLLEMLPHLVIKAEVVAKALEYIALQERPAKDRVDYSRTVERGGRRWVAPLARPEHTAEVLRIFDAIRACNVRAAPANARRAYAS